MCRVLGLHSYELVEVSVMTDHDCHISTIVNDDGTICRVLGQHTCGLSDVLDMTEHDCHTSTAVDDDSTIL